MLTARFFRVLANRWAGLMVGLAIALSGCGGGGGSPAASVGAPYILATVISFPSGAVPAGFVLSDTNSAVVVIIKDKFGGTPIPNASVMVNGLAVGYNPADAAYERSVNVNPGEPVLLSVVVGGVTYNATGNQYSTYPAFNAPAPNATWSRYNTNVASWSGGQPVTAGTRYAFGVLDTSGTPVWPADGALLLVPVATTSVSINADSLTAGSRLLIAGAMNLIVISGAESNSGFVLGGFNYLPVTVDSSLPPPPPPVAPSLVSIAVAPSNSVITSGTTKAMTATGTYSDASTQNLTSQVTWGSSDVGKVTVASTGIATRVSGGSVTVTASLGAISGSAQIAFFQPTPSPVPPLTQAVAYQVDYAHSGRAVFGAPLVYPVVPTWTVTLNGAVSYPLIAGGKVFVTAAGLVGSGAYGTTLYALDKATGSTAWGPVVIAGTYFWSGIAYDNGKLFVVNYDGLIRTYDAGTGVAGWTRQLTGVSSVSAPPTAVNGILYVGAGGGSLLFAIDASTGDVLWKQAVAGGDQSSPSIAGDGVFVTYPCQAYKFDPVTGVPAWHYSGGCSGGGGRTSPVANGQLYMRDWTTISGISLNAGTGIQTGAFSQARMPAFYQQTGFFTGAGPSLVGINLNTSLPLWTFNGDGGLSSAPIVVDQTVFVGSTSGNIYALDATNGVQLWSANAGAAILSPDEQNVSQPLTGLAAGEGYLVVPAGNVVTGWHLSGP